MSQKGLFSKRMEKRDRAKDILWRIQLIKRSKTVYLLNPEWFNGNGDVNEYNNKQSRPDADDAWHENVFKNEYPKQYKDLEDWKK